MDILEARQTGDRKEHQYPEASKPLWGIYLRAGDFILQVSAIFLTDKLDAWPPNPKQGSKPIASR